MINIKECMCLLCSALAWKVFRYFAIHYYPQTKYSAVTPFLRKGQRYWAKKNVIKSAFILPRAQPVKEGKVHPLTCHAWHRIGVDVVLYLYPFLNLGAGCCGWSAARPGVLPLGKSPCAHFTGGWLDTRIGLGRYGVEKIGYFAASGFRNPRTVKLVYIFS